MSTHYILEARTRHHAALLALAPDNKLSGLQLWRKLRRLERMTHAAAVAQCNGEPYGGQPYREEAEWEKFKSEITAAVVAIFGGKLPPGFYINGDPRGHSLKLRADGDSLATPFSLEQDWGGNQILAPDIR